MPYQIGDRVKIKDRLNCNPSCSKSKYAGTVMTVVTVVNNLSGIVRRYRMEEDGRVWGWDDEHIAGYAADFETPESIDDPTLPQITFEQMLAGTTAQQ